MDDYYCDTHFCLACRQMIDGLDNYIEHRKQRCFAPNGKSVQLQAGSDTSKVSPGTGFTSADAAVAVPNPSASVLDFVVDVRPTGELVEVPGDVLDGLNVILYAENVDGESAQFFVDSLRRRSGSVGGDDNDGTTFFEGAELCDPKIEVVVNPPSLERSFGVFVEDSSVFNDLDLKSDDSAPSSDSDDGRSRLRDVGTAKSGGEPESYRRSERLAGKRSEGKGGWRSSKREGKGACKNVSAKRRLGEQPASLHRHRRHTSRGKRQTREGEDVEEENAEERDKEEEDIRGKAAICKRDKSGSENPADDDVVNERKTASFCEMCDKSYSSEWNLKRHMTSAGHETARGSRPKNEKAREIGETAATRVQTVSASEDPPVPQKKKLSCILRDEFFSSRRGFATHVDEKHGTAADAGLEVPTPFQCRVCDYHADGAERLLVHLRNVEHAERVRRSGGALVCVPCRRPCDGNDDMIAHVTSRKHVEASRQPCVFKARRCADRRSVVCLESPRGAGGRTSQGRSSPRSSTSQVRRSTTLSSRSNLDGNVRPRRATQRPTTSFRCRTCYETFADDGAFRLHKQDKRHQDALVASFLDREDLRKRPRTVDGGRREEKEEIVRKKRAVYNCKECDFVGGRHSEVVAHRATAHAPPGCTVCRQRFADARQHGLHLQSARHRRAVEEANELGGTALTCDRCPEAKFYTVRSLKLHEVQHQVATGRDDDATGRDDDATGRDDNATDVAAAAEVERRCRTLKRDAGGAFATDGIECPECGKNLTRKGILPHLRQHAGIFPYRCTICEKRFADVSVLRRHLQVHLGIRAYRCRFCACDFLRHQALGTHVRREHREASGAVASHLCSVCGRRFDLANHLNAHLKLHDKTLPCLHPGCTMLFRYESELALHAKVHTKEAPFLCDECGHAAPTRYQLSRHRLVHTGERRYPCAHCSYRGALPANLKRHQRLHTGAKPYHCPHCQYACNTVENLRKHILKTRSHAGKPVYPCGRCDGGFGCNSAVEFQRHLETVHGIPRGRLPSIIAGLYRRDLDVKIQPPTTHVETDLKIETVSNDD